MHQLPDDLKRQGPREISRVLQPGDRLLVVDFRRSVHGGSWSSDIHDQPAFCMKAGFSQIETGETGFRGLGFALGKISGAGAEQKREFQPLHVTHRQSPHHNVNL